MKIYEFLLLRMRVMFLGYFLFFNEKYLWKKILRVGKDMVYEFWDYFRKYSKDTRRLIIKCFKRGR